MCDTECVTGDTGRREQMAYIMLETVGAPLVDQE